MEKQRNGNNSSTSGTENLKGRKSDHNDRGASNKVLPFSIEAILSAPHPKKERMPVTRKRPHSSAQEHSAADWSPLTTLEDFTSSNLPEDAAKPENAETASRSLQQKLMAFQARLNARKRRKARTCFTNQQIFELERRFVYQKYLSPSDRDEIAHSLGISGAQVITWFQNRRAKFRRDLEELKSDVQAAKIMDNKQVSRLCKRLEI
ncbi:Transcription factor lbx1 [Desmophyllum pertusum]|uniref:Transcription factor lbx1 n=1 Tax=Desmophyllum pertusum TaxID=174260 RepID=A0A9W9YE12_9CNID|nr:Transcription factor lbx1 [Desmophyllum pertusum]